jgi:hypothetical protein
MLKFSTTGNNNMAVACNSEMGATLALLNTGSKYCARQQVTKNATEVAWKFLTQRKTVTQIGANSYSDSLSQQKLLKNWS